MTARGRNASVSLLLALLLLRAYIPIGFMPASGSLFLLEFCPAAASTPMPAHHHHTDTHRHFDNCPFGSAPAAGPISQLLAFAPAAPAVSRQLPVFLTQLGTTRLPVAYRPRGPPSLV